MGEGVAWGSNELEAPEFLGRGRRVLCRGDGRPSSAAGPCLLLLWGSGHGGACGFALCWVWGPAGGDGLWGRRVDPGQAVRSRAWAWV